MIMHRLKEKATKDCLRRERVLILAAGWLKHRTFLMEEQMKLITALLLLIPAFAFAQPVACTLNGTTLSCPGLQISGSPPPPVNGQCGAANGQTFSTPPVSGLCAAGTPTTVLSAAAYTWSCIGSSGGTTASCSATISNPSTCGPGEVFGVGDYDENPLTTTHIYPQQPISANGDFGRAIRFVADAKAYPNGITMEVVDQTPQLLPKDAVISVCPHNFVPVKNQNTCMQTFIPNMADIGLRFGPAQAWYDCALTPGTTYYLNFRDSNQPRGTVWSQFNNLAR